ncbi:NrfD/PsrC family molybdoenzyme membrane anchor subunit [Carboxydothermus hydrogenoformans]|uniref:Putative molybdopterin oxidoreductase, membrane subunit n=1 Tax=Carboxydothermus hydrogenoformans (strain ATCC BAA-161 / DSM 6008 / Z-2901) TaxID=246194 RepID=Q3A919_CARHZ|nr:NrfD/PsrC family molybdoenzyme membrane anchor subunit [Carboxydothermus hydrogenoformans]ABB15000.1 putative molybdopterin oxidoreductase, membrane subunit [Carboxydothermus hydrogenoformans Z-2901]
MAWGMIIAIYLFLAGAGAGAFLIAVMTERSGINKDNEALIKAGTILAAPLVAIGTLFLVLDLTWVEAGKFEPWRIFYLYTHFTSMITWGTWILTLFMPVSFVYGWMKLKNPYYTNTALRCAGAVLAFATSVYTGVLLGVVKAVPFWNNAVIPVLFVVSALVTGMATAILGSFVFGGKTLPDFFKPLHTGLAAIELLLLFFLLIVATHGPEAARQSAEMIVSGKYSLYFWGVLVFLGIIIPGVIGATASPKAGKGIKALDALLVLAGGFTLRALILLAAVPVTLMN